MKRGEIYYIQRRETVGSEIAGARPAVIVSNNALNDTSPVVEVVFLTTKPKKDMPTHVAIQSTGADATALCEQVCSVSRQLVGKFCATCTQEEMEGIDEALLISLGLDAPRAEQGDKLADELAKAIAGRDAYRRMLYGLLDQVGGLS
jgi:mRNA interferase MazF